MVCNPRRFSEARRPDLPIVTTVETGESLRGSAKGFKSMSQLLRIARLRLVATGISLSLAWLSCNADARAQSAPHRMANPYYTPLPAAANSAATLIEPKVVYPAVTTNPVPVKGLPRDRAAALRAAVSVATLDDAYRAGIAASEVATSSHLTVAVPQPTRSPIPTNEPRRFAPYAATARLSTSNGVASTNAPLRRDTAVRPVVWLSDEPSPKPAESLSNRVAVQPQPLDVGNPLRRDVTSISGNPLR